MIVGDILSMIFVVVIPYIIGAIFVIVRVADNITKHKIFITIRRSR